MDLYLKETDTIWILDIPGTWVDKESEEAAEVTEKNAKYKEVSTQLAVYLVIHCVVFMM